MPFIAMPPTSGVPTMNRSRGCLSYGVAWESASPADRFEEALVKPPRYEMREMAGASHIRSCPCPGQSHAYAAPYG